MKEVGMPLELVPEWPDTGTQNIARLIDNTKKHLDKKLDGLRNNFLHSQLRALDYLYGRRDEALNDKDLNNPLVDIIALIGNIGDKRSSASTFQIAIEGVPDTIPLFAKSSIISKPEQRTYEVKPWGRKEYRTIARFSGQISTVLKGLSLLTEASKHHPLIVRSAVHEYSSIFGGGKESTAGTSLGLLEILHNLDLLHDTRFFSLSSKLRGIVFEEVKSYKELKEKYSYRVIDKRTFWYQGEVDTYARRKMNYVKLSNRDKIDVESFPKISIPAIEGWQRKSRERSKIIKERRGLTLYNSIKRTAINFSESKAVKAVIEDRFKKADLTEQKRNLESRQYGKLRRTWRQFIEIEIDEGSNITENEEKLINDSVNILLNYFVSDPALSQKARTNILGRKRNSDNNTYYQIDSKNLAKDYLFSWVLSLRNPYIAKGLKESLIKSEESVDSFYLLTKLMVFEVLKKSLGTKEYKFLFDPNYKHKFNTKSILALFGDIEKLGENYTPDINEIVQQAIRENFSNIEDLLSESSIEKKKKDLEKLIYKKMLGGLTKDKAVAFVEADKKQAKAMGGGLALALGICSLPIVGYKGIIKINAHRDAKNEEEFQARLAESAAAYVIRSEEETKKQAEEERMQRIQEQVIARVERKPWQEKSIVHEAANMARIPGEITDRIPDAIRFDGEDNLARNNSERYGLTGFGKIYHLPEHMLLKSGEPVGYFPWDINLATDWDNDIDTLYWYRRTEYIKPFEQTLIIDEIDSLYIEYAPDQLAYSLNGVNAEIYPPIGWKIVKVFQEGGKQPMIGPLGELYYAYDNYDNFPKRALLILEETPREFIDPKIAILSEVNLGTYWPRYSGGRVKTINDLLKGDEILQQMHASFIEEMDIAKSRLRYEHDEDVLKEVQKEWSDVAIKYAKLYADYTVQERHYALDFQVDKTKDGGYLTLRALADQPDSGYFCSVASFAFRDFMRSVGIVTGNQPGITLFNHQEYMWGGLGHQNNIVFLPDGRVLEVDMTPYVTDKTSQEDLDWLTGRIVTEEEIRKAIEDITLNTNDLNAPETAPVQPTDEELLAQIAQDREIIKFIQNNKNYRSDSELKNTLKDVSQSARELISERIRETKDFNTIFNEKDLDVNEQEIKLLNRISVNAQRIQDNSVSMENIYLNKASGEQILEKYDLTEEIIRDAELLQTILKSQTGDVNAKADLLALDKIISDTKELQETLNQFGRERLEQAREDRVLVSELEHEYRKFKALEGNNAKIEIDYESFSQSEILRAERFKEENREISDDELKSFNRTVGKHSWDANNFINSAYEAPIPDNVEHDDPPYINGYSWQQITHPVKLSRLISNTPDVYGRLDEKSKSLLKNLTGTYRQMDKIFRENHQGLNSEVEKMKVFSDDLEYLYENLSAIIEGKKLQALYEANEHKRFEGYTQRYLEEREKQTSEEEEKNSDIEEENTALDMSKFGNIAKKFGVGAIPLAIGYLGIKNANKRKKKKEILDRIQKSLSSGGNLTQIEKDLVLSTVGHLAHLKYDDNFPEKAAAILNLIQQYSSTEHEDAVRWLINDGTVALCEKSPVESFAVLAELSSGKSSNGSAKEIQRYFPETVTEELEILSKENGKNGKVNDIEIPHDYGVIYGISQIMFNRSLIDLQKDVRRRLEIENTNSTISVEYKSDDLLDFLRSKYASNNTPEKAKSIFNSILFLLQWSSTSSDEPMFTD